MVTLQNISRTMFVANLTHYSFAEDPGPFGHKTVHTHVVDQDPRTGALGARRVSRLLPSSLRILAGEVSEPLPNGVLECPDVKRELNKSVRIVRQTEDEPMETKAAELPENVIELHPQEALKRARLAKGKATGPEEPPAAPPGTPSPPPDEPSPPTEDSEGRKSRRRTENG